jgi:mannosylglycoprotein endo-beta-mannosidase
VYCLDLALESRGLSEAEAELRRRMKMRCLGLSSLERTMARQRSRIRHLSEGDANTAYFHLIARGRRRRSAITSLIVDGHTVSGHEGMEHAMYDHFSRVFGTAVHSGMTLNFDSLAVPSLSFEELDANITEDETRRAIQELPADRAPGPDDFTGAFYKASWTAIRVEVMEAIKAFNSGNHRGLERLNNALIVLLPKKVGASCPTDFRPITMIHSFAKLISKILALRLAPRMNELVNKN